VLSHESCCCWCSGCRLLIAIAAVAYQVAVPVAHWVTVTDCVRAWNARPWSTPQVTLRAGHNVKTDGPRRAGSTELAGRIAGRIWPTCRTLPTAALKPCRELFCLITCIDCAEQTLNQSKELTLESVEWKSDWLQLPALLWHKGKNYIE